MIANVFAFFCSRLSVLIIKFLRRFCLIYRNLRFYPIKLLKNLPTESPFVWTEVVDYQQVLVIFARFNFSLGNHLVTPYVFFFVYNLTFSYIFLILILLKGYCIAVNYSLFLHPTSFGCHGEWRYYHTKYWSQTTNLRRLPKLSGGGFLFRHNLLQAVNHRTASDLPTDR